MKISVYLCMLIGFSISPFSQLYAQPAISTQDLSVLSEIRPFADLYDVIITSNQTYETPEGQLQKNRLFSADSLSLLTKDRTCPQTDESYHRALALFKQKKWLEAKAAFTLLVNKGSKSQQVCVQYKLGQVESRLGDYVKAYQRFTLTYRLVADGSYPDPLHLGIDSLGEMAGTLLDQIGQRSLEDNGKVIWRVGVYEKNLQTSYHEGSPLTNEGVENNGDDSWALLEKAVDSYADQVKLGNVTGIDSISVIMEGITDPDNSKAKILLKKAILTEQIRNILWAYLFNAQEGIYYISSSESRNYILSIFLETVDNKDIDIGGTESYVAALAYQDHYITKALQFAKFRWVISKEQDPLAGWVLAKIAYQQGDVELAKDYYAKAAAAAILDGKAPKLLRKYIVQENEIIKNLHTDNPVLSP